MDKQVTLYKLDRFTKGVLVLIAVFLGILVFKPLVMMERVYVANFPRQQSVYVDSGTVDIRQSKGNPIYVEVVGNVDVEVNRGDYMSPFRVQVTNFP